MKRENEDVLREEKKDGLKKEEEEEVQRLQEENAILILQRNNNSSGGDGGDVEPPEANIFKTWDGHIINLELVCSEVENKGIIFSFFTAGDAAHRSRKGKNMIDHCG